MTEKMYASGSAETEAEKQEEYPAAWEAFDEKVKVTDGKDQQEIRDWCKSFWHSEGPYKASPKE